MTTSAQSFDCFAMAPFTAGDAVALIDSAELTQEVLPAGSMVLEMFFTAQDPLSGPDGQITIGGQETSSSSLLAAADGVTISGLTASDLAVRRSDLISASTQDQSLVLTCSSSVSYGTVRVIIYYVSTSMLP
jgi:hypothetical protein